MIYIVKEKLKIFQYQNIDSFVSIPDFTPTSKWQTFLSLEFNQDTNCVNQQGLTLCALSSQFTTFDYKHE